MASNNHATSSVKDSIVWISCYIIKEVEKVSVGVFGYGILLLSNLVEVYKKFLSTA